MKNINIMKKAKDLEMNLLNETFYLKGSEILDELKIQPLKYEPIRNNRFVVKFPKEIGIAAWTIDSISTPNIFNGKWNNTNVNIKNLISENTPMCVLDNLLKKKNFEITLEFLDPVGASIQKWNISIKKIISVDFGGIIEYGNDSVNLISVVMQTKKCNLTFGV